MNRLYAGIGSRHTPTSDLDDMRALGIWLAQRGWTLRSGGAEGADTHFELGCDAGSGMKEIFLPYKGFNNNRSLLHSPTPEAIALAGTLHPAWDRCNHAARKLHGRNCHQVLGADLQTPVQFVVCWTKSGGLTGGTALAMRLAMDRKIKVLNLHDRTVADVQAYCIKLEIKE